MATRSVVATIAGILLALAIGLEAQAPPKGSGTLEVTGPVRVIDGDTFEVYIGGRQVAIGIIGIKAPRVNTRCGRKAAELMNQLANGSDGLTGPITLRFDEDESITFDTRKRRMYHLTLPVGVSAAAELVRAGLADVDGSAPEDLALSAAASQASRCVD